MQGAGLGQHAAGGVCRGWWEGRVLMWYHGRRRFEVEEVHRFFFLDLNFSGEITISLNQSQLSH